METIIQKALRLLLDKFGADYDCVMVTEENGNYYANIETTDPPRLIGKNGNTLKSLQVILKNILWKQTSGKVFVTVDVDNYKRDRENKMLDKVKYSVDKMKEHDAHETKLRPMSAYNRRIVHTWIAKEYPELTTDSIGEGAVKAVRIFYK